MFSSLDEEGKEEKKKEEETEGVALADRKQYAYQLVGTPNQEQVKAIFYCKILLIDTYLTMAHINLNFVFI